MNCWVGAREGEKDYYVPTYTNNFGLPQPIFDAVVNDQYDKGDSEISVTGLIRPARISILEKDHAHEIEEDVSERIWSLVGQVMHGILERAEDHAISELRLFAPIIGIKVSGQIDRFIPGKKVLQDYKFVTIKKFQFNKWQCPEEYEQQLNCYAYLLKLNAHDVEKIELIAILRDWYKTEAQRNKNYPRVQVLQLDVPLWPIEKQKAFLEGRVRTYMDAHTKLPECTSEERWARPPKWAVMKDGRKTALRVFDSPDDAAYWSQNQKNQTDLRIEHRPGQNIRCEGYCRVAKFCDQHNKYLDLKGDSE